MITELYAMNPTYHMLNAQAVPTARCIGRKSWAAMIAAVLLLLSSAHAQKETPKSSSFAEGCFIENRGQWPQEVLFLYQARGLELWITRHGLVQDWYTLEGDTRSSKTHINPPHTVKRNRIGQVVRLCLVGSNPTPQGTGYAPKTTYHNYFLGNDPAHWATRVPLFQEVIVQNVYPGIDVRYYTDQGHVRYDFLVAPGADPSQIRFTLQGADEETLEQDKIAFRTRFGIVEMTELRAYQAGQPITCHFVQKGSSYGIELGPYDNSLALLIDPLIYSTYLGGSGSEEGTAIAVDATGNAYVTGYTFSANYPITTGAYQTTHNGPNEDAFVTKLNANGDDLIFSTFIGGASADKSNSIVIDASGDVYITGNTGSTDFPTTPGSYRTTNAGAVDAFVTKLRGDGTGLIYSTYLGGVADDVAVSIAVDANGKAHVLGFTISSDYPVSANAYQTTYTPPYSAIFVTRLRNTGSGIEWSTLVSGSADDWPSSIAIDASGNVYIVGHTYSSNYPITSGAVQQVFGYPADGFITKINSSGTALVYSTFLGGNGTDLVIDIAIEASGAAYVVGLTGSNNFPTTSSAYQPTYRGSEDGFLTKINPAGTAWVYSTFIGDTSYDIARTVAVDGSGNAYAAGWTFSKNFPVTPGAAQDTLRSPAADGFVIKISADGSSLLHGTYLGGSADDGVMDIALGSSGHVYGTGFARSNNLLLTVGAYQTVYGGGMIDAFVFKHCPAASNAGCSSTAIPSIQAGSFPWRITPNPAQGQTILHYEGPGERFTVSDLSGRLLYAFDAQPGENLLQLSLPSGLYLLSDSHGHSQKLLVE